MKKRKQINLNLEDSEYDLVTEYCRVHDRTPQWLYKTGALRIINEDIAERKADLMTIQSWREIQEGKSSSIDDLLEMIEEDRRAGNGMLSASDKMAA